MEDLDRRPGRGEVAWPLCDATVILGSLKKIDLGRTRGAIRRLRVRFALQESYAAALGQRRATATSTGPGSPK